MVNLLTFRLKTSPLATVVFRYVTECCAPACSVDFFTQVGDGHGVIYSKQWADIGT